ncbi:hypothetical protein F7725_002868 [Dissostichus mawsoni]|uniref:Uncharacterized protein n=1 Tax=Dissostichus mawsoni TaxID=36200 RepID=A0A7J5Y8S0_DISMA|nr:hypothetical protein F7725_002868 [Dissostichus mawsoni]
MCTTFLQEVEAVTLRSEGEQGAGGYQDTFLSRAEKDQEENSDINVTTFDEHCRVDFPFVSHKLRARHGGKDENRERGQLVITIMWVI